MNGDGAAGVVALVGLLALNRLIVALAGNNAWRWLFWTVQLTNLAAAIFLLTVGLPGLPEGLWVVNWFIGLLFVWHIVLNNARRVRLVRAAIASSDGDEERREALRQRLGQRPGAPPADPP